MLCKNNRIEHIVNHHHKFFFAKKNVLGVAYGEKYVGGVSIGEPAVQILVRKKLEPEEIKESDLIPGTYHGERTDVIEIGNLKALGLNTRSRPMNFGYSIGPSNSDIAGSAGCLVYDTKAYYILSNNHIMAAENTATAGTPILQPAKVDGGDPSADVIANLKKFVSIQFISGMNVPINYVDAAIAEVVNQDGIISRDIAMIGRVKGFGYPELNLMVQKAGRVTVFTTAIILSLGAIINVEYSGGKVAQFKNQIITTSLASPGDSGSLVVDETLRAIGLLFAGSETISVLNPIKSVLNSLEVNLATN